MKHKPLKSILSISVLILIVALFLFYIFSHISDFQELFAIGMSNIWLIVVLAIFALIGSTLNGMITDNLVRIFGIRLKFKEWFGLSVVTTFYNMITPFRGGMAVRAVYLKQKHKFSYVNFLAALAGTYVITFLIASSMGLLSLFLLYRESGIFNWIVLLIFLFFFIPLTLIVLFSPRFPETKNNFVNKFIKVMNGWNLIRKNKRMVTIASIITFLIIIIGCFTTIISYYLFGIHISFAQALFLTTLASLGILISITPAGLGIQEAIAVFSALVIGITPTQSIAVAILNRAVGMIVIFTLGPIFSYILLKHKSKDNNKINNK